MKAILIILEQDKSDMPTIPTPNASDAFKLKHRTYVCAAGGNL
jgi:hypothetical protein